METSTAPKAETVRVTGQARAERDKRRVSAIDARQRAGCCLGGDVVPGGIARGVKRYGLQMRAPVACGS